MSHQYIKRWIIIISGFSQHEGAPSGLLTLYQRLYWKYVDQAPSYDPPTQVLLRGWNNPWNHLAGFIADSSDGKPEIYVIGYSLGGGWGAPRICEELAERDIEVQHAVLSEPIYRSPWLGGRVRAIIPPRWPKYHWHTRKMRVWQWIARKLYYLGRQFPWMVPVVELPDTVGQVTVFRQSNDVPMGHEVMHLGHIVPATEIYGFHSSMDDAAEFHEACDEAIA